MRLLSCVRTQILQICLSIHKLLSASSGSETSEHVSMMPNPPCLCDLLS